MRFASGLGLSQLADMASVYIKIVTPRVEKPPLISNSIYIKTGRYSRQHYTTQFTLLSIAA